MGVSPKTMLWLFFLPIIYKNSGDFDRARNLVEQSESRSVASFVPAETHPYNCWNYDRESGILEQFIPNGVFRRQDLPPAWMLYHYICCFRAEVLDDLNDELVCSKTQPFFLSQETSRQLIEIDTPEDYERWNTQKLAQKPRWK